MQRPTMMLWTMASIGSLLALAVAATPPKPIPTDIPQPVDQLPGTMRPATNQELQEAMRDVSKNPRPSVEERLARIERLVAEIQHEAQELRQDLHLPPQTQPANLRDIPVRFR